MRTYADTIAARRHADGLVLPPSPRVPPDATAHDPAGPTAAPAPATGAEPPADATPAVPEPAPAPAPPAVAPTRPWGPQ